jgi:hypothetical protein
MPGRRHYRGPRRPGQPGEGDGSGGGPEAEARSAPIAASEGDAGASGSEGERSGRRRRRRGGRGHRPEGDVSGASASENGGDPSIRSDFQAGPRAARSSAPDAQRGEGSDGAAEGEGAKRRRRRRGGRSRSGQGVVAGGIAMDEAPDEEGAPPSDYIAFEVERGTPLLYQERALVPVEDEEDAPEVDRRPAKSRRLNSGKLFWYIRSKSYIPIPELRRRFEVSSEEMSTIQDDGQKVFVGLPQDLADVVATLRRQNKIGLEVAPEFSAPVVVGIYPLFH